MSALRGKYNNLSPERKQQFAEDMTALLSGLNAGYVAWTEQQNEDLEAELAQARVELATLRKVLSAVLEGATLEPVIARYKRHVANMQTVGIEDVYHSSMLAALEAYKATEQKGD